MSQQERARQIAQIIVQQLQESALATPLESVPPILDESCGTARPGPLPVDLPGEGAEPEALPGVPVGGAQPATGFTISRREGCAACNPGTCARCGHLFTGEAIDIIHPQKGRRVLSDKAVHYLSHGVTSYETGYVIHGQPVVVELDLDEIAGYLDLS